MNLKTRYNLWKIQRGMSPDRLFKAELSKKLNIIWDANYSAKHTWYKTVWFKHATGFASVVLMAGSLSTGAYAYTSPEVTEGSVLYPIKEKLENIEEKVKITPEAKAKFYLKKIERREAERNIIKEKTEDKKDDKEIKKLESEDLKEEIKLESKEKIKVEVAERRIKRTEKSIEKAEEQLEKIRQTMEKTESKNIKLREVLKKRAEQRLESLKNKR